ncbi:unnamed protein product [Closterium sp. NIES-54]
MLATTLDGTDILLGLKWDSPRQSANRTATSATARPQDRTRSGGTADSTATVPTDPTRTGRTKEAAGLPSRERVHSPEFVTLRSIDTIHTEKRRGISHVHRLPRTEPSYHQVPLPHPASRRTDQPTLHCLGLLENRPSRRLPPDPRQPTQLPENNFSKTTFRTHYRSFKYTVMPFGLTNAPATFKMTMNEAFRPLLDKCVNVYLDDTLIYSPNRAQHLQDIEAVFKILSESRMLTKSVKASRRWDTKNLLKQGNEVRSQRHSASSTSITNTSSSSTSSSSVNSSNSSSSSASRANVSSSSATNSSSSSSSVTSANDSSSNASRVSNSRLRRVSSSSAPNTTSLGSSITPSTSTSRTSSRSTSSTTSSSSKSSTSNSSVSSGRVSSSGSSTPTAGAPSKPLAQLLRGERLRPGRQSWRSTRRTSRRSSTPRLNTPRLRTLRLSTPRLNTLWISTPRLHTRTPGAAPESPASSTGTVPGRGST